jgi:hypothetical protein
MHRGKPLHRGRDVGLQLRLAKPGFRKFLGRARLGTGRSVLKPNSTVGLVRKLEFADPAFEHAILVHDLLEALETLGNAADQPLFM